MKGIIILVSLSLFLVLLTLNSVAAEQAYLNRNETWGWNLTGVFHSSIVFGDLDNDGDMDMISSGCTSGGVTTCTTAITRVHINNGTSLIESQAWQQNLIGVGLSSLALGDIDNDGDLDLVLAGDKGGFSGTMKVYSNEGNTFVEMLSWESNLTGISVIGGSVALGDVNDDGRLDLALVGASSSFENGIYINNGTSFIKDYSWLESLPLVGQGNGLGVVVWGDVDSDADLDIVFSGSYTTNFYDNVHINSGTSLIANSTWREDLGMFGWPSLTLGDYDNDGDLDLVYMGTHTGDWFYTYNNNGKKFVQDPLIYGYFDGSVAWGDYDNDGDLDLAPMGKESGRNRIFSNENAGFVVDDYAGIDFRPDDMQQGSLAWIDIDGDGDLDLICSGNSISNGTYMTRVYINNITNVNTKPNPSDNNFNSTFNFSIGKLTLSWGNGSDAETPTLGLYYNLRVGTCSGCHDVVSGIYGGSSNPTTGYFGNMMQRKSVTLNRPDLEGKTIYWAVQTIDTGLARSNWSEEQVYVIGTCMEDWSYSEWSACISGIQTRTAADLNNCGTTSNRGALSQSCTVPGGPPGPSGYVPPTVDPNKATKNWNSILPEDEQTFTVNRANISVTEITIRVSESVSNPSITISRLSSKPTTETPQGRVYQYLEIDQTNLEEKLASVSMTFAVSASWIGENNINHSAVYTNRFINETWERLETSLLETGDSYIYAAESPGLSYFSITGEEILPQICDTGERRCNGNRLEECSDDGTAWQLVEDCDYGCMNSTCLDVVCQAGQTRCSENMLEQCHAFRWIPLETCEFGCASGRCLPSPFYHELLVAAVLVALGVLPFLFFVRERHGKEA